MASETLPQLVPVQSQIERLAGSPEGVYYAECGKVVVDFLTGNLYIKQTTRESNTGWAKLQAVPAPFAGGGNFIGNGSPEGVVTAPPGATYFDIDTEYRYNKKTGNGNTGWV